MAFATSASASQICAFDQECLEGENCAETTYEVSLAETDDAAWTLSDITGDRPATAMGQTWFAPTGDGTDGGLMLTIGPDGMARMSVHMIGAGLSILYLGQCSSG